MKEVGLVDVCTNRNGSNAPPTYARGTLPIDAIYVSVNLTNSQAGYLPVVSNHRVLWVDMPQRSLFGSRLALIPTRIPQRFTLHDPRVVSRYINSVSSQFQEARLLPRLLELQSQMAEQCTDQLIKIYNELDAIRLQGILRANKSCRRLKMGQVDFSPALAMAWNKIRAWKLLKRKLSGGRVNSRYLQRELKAANISDISLLTLSNVEANLATAYREYKQLKKQASSLRATWIEGLVLAKQADGKTSVAQELKNLLARERQRNKARFIKHILNQNSVRA
jgi:hypothetical protein